MSKKRKILVADDDVQFVDSLKTLLESAGYEVFFTYRSSEVIEKTKSIEPHLILLDVMFAGPRDPDGFKIARLLHSDPELKNIPVIIISGVRKVWDLPSNLVLDEKWIPVKAFIEKPFKPAELLSKIKKAIGP
jgi:two-component system alkaline phosphatase synthesis response regulator PhoP